MINEKRKSPNAILTCVDDSRGCGRRGRPWGNNGPPPGFDQQAFVAAMGATAATIA